MKIRPEEHRGFTISNEEKRRKMINESEKDASAKQSVKEKKE